MYGHNIISSVSQSSNLFEANIKGTAGKEETEHCNVLYKKCKKRIKTLKQTKITSCKLTMSRTCIDIKWLDTKIRKLHLRIVLIENSSIDCKDLSPNT